MEPARCGWRKRAAHSETLDRFQVSGQRVAQKPPAGPLPKCRRPFLHVSACGHPGGEGHLVTVEAKKELTESRCQLLCAGSSRVIAERPLNISCQCFPLLAEFNQGSPWKAWEARLPRVTEGIVRSLPVVVVVFHVHISLIR
jgi:hypothetical protein